MAAFELSGTEIELLRECCRLLDEVEDLHSARASEGLSVPGSNGQPRVHPGLGELRQHRLALGRLLAQLQLPEEPGALASPVQAKARVAGHARWQAHNAAVAARRAAGEDIGPKSGAAHG
jgi:hypothetical protein